MLRVDAKSLVGKLDDACRRALQAAAGLCVSRTNYDVEIEHLLLKLIEAPGTDLAALLRHYEIDASRLAGDLTRALDRLKTGNARSPSISPRVADLLRAAWDLASIEYGAARVRSGHVLCALVSDDMLVLAAGGMSRELAKLSADVLRKELPQIVANTPEAAEAAAGAGNRPPPKGPRPTGVNTKPERHAPPPAAPAPGLPPEGPGQPGVSSQAPSLAQFTIDLTARARAGEIDPVLGRDAEVRQIVDILTRRRQNNPILTGEAGVGKTAVVEGFARRVAEGDVPPALRNAAVRTLDLGLLQAGAGIKGEFENRLKSVIDEVKRSPQPIILFIDEAHTMIGAGGQQGSGDAANLLKPALARGELRTIAATTWAEYKKYFEKDAALARRFQVVKIEEPGEAACVEMMRGLVDTLQKHHHVTILEEAVGQAHALEAVAERIRTWRAGLTDPRRPIGVFLMAGPSGVGKTETGLTLAELLYGGDQNMTVINMSEFKEEHKVSLLMGSPQATWATARRAC